MKGSWQFLRIITSPAWLRSARPYYLAALPLFVLPAALFTCASIGIHFANGFASSQFTVKEIGLPNLLVALAVFFVAFVVGTPLLIYSVVRWMFSITVFTEYWLAGPLSQVSFVSIAERKDNAAAIVKERQKYLTSYWLYCSIFTLIPAFVAMSLLTMKAYSMMQPTALPSNFTAVIDCVLCPLGCLLGSFSLVSSFVAISISASAISKGKSELTSSAKASAWRAWRLSFTFFPQAFVCVLVLGAIHTIVDNPEILYKLDKWQEIFNPQENPFKLVFGELWQGLTSVIFVPLSVVPLCEMLRSLLNEPDQIAKP